jgi:hypothetical protein
MSISISSEVLGTLSVTVAETTGVLSVSVLATAPAVLSMELGTPGPAATVTVGTTTTLSAGSSATVTNAGTSLAAVLNFGIPQGPTGATGAQGPAGTSGIVYATSPLSYNSGTQTVSIDLSAYATKASPTFTGDPKAPTPATSDNDTSIATTAFVKAQGYATTDALASYALLAGSSNFSVTSGTIKSMASDDNFVQLNETRLEFGNGITPSGLSVTGTGITFADSTVQTTAAVSGLPDAPSDGSTYGRKDGAWEVVSGGSSFNGGAVANPITIAGTTYDSEMASDYFGIELSSDHTQFATLEYNKLTVANGSGSMQVTPAGITFTDSTTQYTAFNPYDYATLASPTFTGTPTAPTATTGDSSTQIATTAFVQDAVIAGSAHAETLQATVRNNTGATLSPFTVVYINGALGNKATVAKAQANSEATSSGTFAVTQASIANNADGIVISAGVLSNINTSSYTDGDKLYLSPTTAGGVTTTKPSAPNHLVYVGVVTRSHPTLGTVSVRIQNGYELDELHDVAIASKTNLDLLAYESSTSLWKNKSFSTLGLATLDSPSLTGTPISTTAAADTNTTQIATTAYVVGQASSTTPAATGTAAVGTSLKYARADHVHANPLPTGGTTGQVLSKVDGTNYNVQWSTASGGGGGVDIQTFGSSTTSGTFTWTKPAGAKFVQVILYGAGGGGASGARQATSVIRGGGAGCSSAGYVINFINADALGSTQAVVVGAGGSGGAAITTDSTNGNAGSVGGDTTFYNFKAAGGGPSNPGTSTGGGAGANIKSSLIFAITGAQGAGGSGGQSTSPNDANAITGVPFYPTGGGGGAGAGAGATTARNGGAGGAIVTATNGGTTDTYAGGVGGVSGGAVATAGTTIASTIYNRGGTGGGGGAYKTATAGGAGNNGGWPGASGGGGAGSDNGFASGKGGDGANGFAVIITYC